MTVSFDFTGRTVLITGAARGIGHGIASLFAAAGAGAGAGAAGPRPGRTQHPAAIPLGRFAAPAEMAPAVAFPASEQAGYITGAVLPVDGGMAM